MALALDTRTALGGFSLGKHLPGPFLRAWFGMPLFGCVFLCRVFRRLLLLRFGKTLASRDRGGIARNMPDQALALSSRDYGLMQLLWQLSGGKFAESTGELRFVGQGAPTGPTTQLA